MQTRPVQEMSDTAAAIRAAREVQADTLSPELFRQANEWFFRAKNEYKLKNFKLAQDYALKARSFAEKAEFEVLKSGGSRNQQVVSDPLSDNITPPPPPPGQPVKKENYPYPTPTGSLYEDAPASGPVPSPSQSQ